jgi:predicted AlkP superfamily phosphohydrolase/phosphomutase
MGKANRVVMIAIDASEFTVIERGIADGTLPHLARLRAQGAYGRMSSTADWLAGTPWASFYTGSLPPEHGFLFHLQWRPDLMRHDRPRPDWLPLRPFYRGFGPRGPKVIAVDVPLTYEVGKHEAFSGVEVTSWSTHDKIAPTTAFPPRTRRWIRRNFGRQPITLDIPEAQPLRDLLQLKDGLLRSVIEQVRLCEGLMQREEWDFLLLGIGAAHRGGHKLWDRSSIEGVGSPSGLAAYDRALGEVYAACDEAVGRLARVAGAGTTVLVGSLHGMSENHSRFDLLPTMLDRILGNGKPGAAGPAPPHRFLQRMRSLVPIRIRNEVKSRLPEPAQDALTRFWRMHDKKDWARTPAFCLMGDLQALVQVNLRGRERQGIVEPGQEYEQILSEIEKGVSSFVDADSGEPVVKRMARGNQLYPESRSRKVQPDLIIDWAETPARLHRALTSLRYGTILWPNPGKPLDGRSGHHVPAGWLLAVGEQIGRGTTLPRLHTHDLNATIHALLGVPQAEGMRGQALPELVGTAR